MRIVCFLAGLALLSCCSGPGQDRCPAPPPPSAPPAGDAVHPAAAPDHDALPGASLPPDAAGEEKYCASRSSKVFHLRTCPQAARIKPENLVRFKTREEAMAKGRKPCKLCSP
ncbi:MAG TPA: Ada metal-binding domain-containing protein [bacterium]|nr:Ada metal-binding domain-containing protein [bacterium]